MAAPASALPACPEDVRKRASILWHNSFSGVQAPGDGGDPNKYIVCWCKELTKEQWAVVKQGSGSETVHLDDYLGRAYIEIHWTEYDKIESVLTSMLQHGHGFALHTKFRVVFAPEKGDKEFKWSMLESKVIREINELTGKPWYKPSDLSTDHHSFPEILFDIWNWKTPMGHTLCLGMRELTGLPHQDPLTDKNNYWLWDCFKGDPRVPVSYDPVTDALESSAETCMICLDRPADTLVLPCEHQVVCAACSAKLQDTPDAHTCVRCRRKIAAVLQNE